jgi:hypothetical protein
MEIHVNALKRVSRGKSEKTGSSDKKSFAVAVQT